MQSTVSPKDSSDSSPILVIGAGMVGIATAIWLQRQGQKVVLLDKGGPEDRASFGNAGVLASASVLPVTMPGLLRKLPKLVLSRTDPIFMRWSYLPKLMPWALRYLSHANETEVRRIATALAPIIGNSLEDHLSLTEGTTARRHIKPCDFAVLFKDQAAFANDLFPWTIRKELGFRWTEVQGAARAAYDPVFDPGFDFLAALAGHGQITDPSAYMMDLRGHFTAQGGVIQQREALDIIHEQGRAVGVMTKDGPLNAAAVVITAGAWSPLLTQKLGVNIPVEAESGYHLEFWDASDMPRMPTLVPSGKFILSPMAGRLRVAGGVEFGGLKNTGSEAPFEALKYQLNQVLPNLTYSKETRWMGHRPAPTDSIPVIGELPGLKGVYLGFGHQHVGLTGSARTGQLLAQMICGKTPNIDMRPYGAARFTSDGRKAAQQARPAHHMEAR